MNRSEFWTIIAAAAAVVVLLWTIWSDVAENRRAISQGFIEVHKEIADVHKEVADLHKVLAAIQVSIADLRTEMIRETSQNREDISRLDSRIDLLEAASKPESAE
jgi:septal ring factor EnvC (AmiA/AmiB activator)